MLDLKVFVFIRIRGASKVSLPQ